MSSRSDSKEGNNMSLYDYSLEGLEELFDLVEVLAGTESEETEEQE